MTDMHDLAAFHGGAENTALPLETRLAAALKVFDNGLEYFLAVLQDEVFEINTENGWFESNRTFGEDIALLHSEVSEALEAFRDNKFRRYLVCKSCGETKDYDDETVFGVPAFGEVEDAYEIHCGALMKPEGVGSEFADILIRLVDCCRRYPTLLARETKLKLAYNASRGHRHGGKGL